jgi:hypothetical protein
MDVQGLRAGDPESLAGPGGFSRGYHSTKSAFAD